MKHSEKVRALRTISYYATGKPFASSEFNKLPGAERIRQGLEKKWRFRNIRQFLLVEA